MIADRNRHVRDYLQREFSMEGYRVLLAKNGRQLLDRISSADALDLVVLDLNIPDERELTVLENIRKRRPKLPVIIHGFSADYRQHPVASGAASFVEKCGGSIEELKCAVSESLQERQNGS